MYNLKLLFITGMVRLRKFGLCIDFMSNKLNVNLKTGNANKLQMLVCLRST